MHTAWISRGEQRQFSSFPQADLTGDDLLHTARAIIAAHLG
jgi:hypothetical protein